MRLLSASTLAGSFVLLLGACATTHQGPVTAADISKIKVGTTRDDVVAAAGQPVSETKQSLGMCLQYEAGAPGQPQPFYVILTPNDRVYETGYDTCEKVGQQG